MVVGQGVAEGIVGEVLAVAGARAAGAIAAVLVVAAEIAATVNRSN